MQWREIVKRNPIRHQVRILKIDRLDPQQGKISLVFFGRSDLSRNRGTCLQSEATDLTGRNVDVIGAGQIVIVGAAQETEAVRQDFQRALRRTSGRSSSRVL